VKWILRGAGVLVIALIAATGVIVGCSGGNGTTGAMAPASTHASSMTPMAPMTTKAKAKATAPASSMMPSGSMPAATGMTPQCDGTNTSVTLGMSNGAAGTLYETLVIKNTSMSPCMTGGYSGLSLDSAMGTQLGQAAGRMGSSGSQVTVQPGHEATEVFSYADAAVSTEMGCNPQPGTALRVYLPDATGFATVPFDHDGCTGMNGYLEVWAVNVTPGM
jgi:hypothetical protein